MKCTFCGKELVQGQACDCAGYKQFAQQMTPPAAPPMTPPPAAPMVKPPMTPPPAATAPPMTPPPAAPMAKPPMTPPPAATAPPMTPPPAAPMAKSPMTPPPTYTAPPVTPPQATYNAPPVTQPQATYNAPPVANTAPPVYTAPPVTPPPATGATQTQAPSMNIEDAKKMGKEAGQKLSSFAHHVKSMLGVTTAEEDDKDPFERGLQIVPDVSSACEGEIPVKQYRVANFRSRLQFLWAEGKVQITNKRVIFRGAGRSLLGKTTLQQEYIIDEIAGISISNGVRFDFFEFFLCLLLLCPLTGMISMNIAVAFYKIQETIGVILNLALIVALLSPYALLKGHLLIKSLGTVGAAVILATMIGYGSFFQWMAILFGIIALVILFMWALRPSVSISVMSKAGTGSPISMSSPSHFKLETAKEMLPAEDIDLVQEEIGAIISDIQKFGDYGIEKWKVDPTT